MSKIKKSILATLAYFDLFDYPLTIDELRLYLSIRCTGGSFEYELKCLIIDRRIFNFDRFYTLKNDYYLVERRLKGNTKADEMIATAKRVGNLLIRFPYVKGIAISGSLSKNFADDKSDIDFFIITQSNKLWIARTIMHCFKKLTFLVNKEDYFCMNYYIDEQALQIREKNIYTAIEVTTLIPLHGDTTFEQFYMANAWYRDFLPNKLMRLTTAKAVKKSFLTRLIEKFFNNKLGEAIDNRLMKITTSRWLKKTQAQKLNAKGLVMSMDADKHYAKPDPKNFQQKLINRYQTRITEIISYSEKAMVH